MMLRNFRDEVLTRFDLGRDFIGWYYANGPIAAEWLIAHPAFRTIALAALLPLEIVAWVALHPAVLWIPFGFLLFLALFFGFRGSDARRFLPLFSS